MDEGWREKIRMKEEKQTGRERRRDMERERGREKEGEWEGGREAKRARGTEIER